jgi:tetratricopeptide (TPR) repeat protein
VKTGRNDPCPCGSGWKYKHCCGRVGVAGQTAPTAPVAASSAAPARADIAGLAGLIGAGRLGDAERVARNLVARFPSAGIVWKALGVTLQLQHQDALPSLARAAELLPDDAEAQANLGAALLEAGQYPEAVRSLQRALVLKPDYADAHSNLGNAWRSQHRFAEAVSSYRAAIACAPEHAALHLNLGHALRALGSHEDALSSYRRALELNPVLLEAHNDLGNALRALGRPEEAVASYRSALSHDPDNAEILTNLAQALLAFGRIDESIATVRRALALKPQLAPAHSTLGDVMLKLSRLREASESYARALEIQPDLLDALNNLAVALRLQGRTEQAELTCRKALAIYPRSAALLAVLADAYADRGEFALAEDAFRRALTVDPGLPQAWAGIAHLRRMSSADAEWLAGALRLADSRLAADKEIPLRYAIGKYFDDVGEFDQAFAQFQRANELTRALRPGHDRQRWAKAVDELIALFSGDWLRQVRGHGLDSRLPVFIVGMPRSGTSLAEQILASHPEMHGAGELSFWNEAARSWLAQGGGIVPGAAVGQFAHEYLGLLTSVAPEALRVIDKMPGNVLHMGLIHAALPNARIIHMRRDPVDTCLSIYFQDFQSAHSYANDLADVADYYRQYLRLMEHWQSILPREAMLTVQYESLVEEQEAWSRRMVEFIGLPWDARCLDFHATRRSVTTASKWQVRQRASRQSVQRWRNYERHLGPLSALASTV